MSYAVDLLESQPKEYRRVLLLVCEERDHGSKHTKPAQLIEKIGGSDVLVLSVSFSPASAELIHDIKDIGRRPGDEYGLHAGHVGAGLQEECDQGTGPA